jgi:hypothetical protein
MEDIFALAVGVQHVGAHLAAEPGDPRALLEISPRVEPRHTGIDARPLERVDKRADVALRLHENSDADPVPGTVVTNRKSLHHPFESSHLAGRGDVKNGERARGHAVGGRCGT